MLSRTLGPNRAYIDSSAMVAVVNRRDGSHALARTIQSRLARERWQLTFSNFVLAETHGLLVSRAGRAAGVAFLDYAQGGAVSVVRVEPEDEQAALSIIHGYDDKDFSYTDATSFAIMERLGLSWAFSFDEDFARYGFQRLV